MKKIFIVFLALFLGAPVGASVLKFGVYEVRLKVGDKEFRDLMTVDSANYLPSGKEELSGTMTVPGVFTSKFVGTTSLTSSFNLRLRFEIIANENGKQYKVRYTAYIPDNQDERFLGVARLEDNTVIGEFTGQLLTKASKD